MELVSLQKKMKQAPPPLQPWLKRYSDNYSEKLMDLNPVNSKSKALYYQFSTNHSEEILIDIVPEQCSDFIFVMNDQKIHSFYSGISRKTRQIVLKPNTTYFGVKPYSAFGTKGWKASPDERFGKQFQLSDVIELGDLQQRIMGATTFNERIVTFQDFFLQNWVDYGYTMGIEEYLAMSLYDAYSTNPIEDIEKQTGYSERYCRKKFKSVYGIAPKKYTHLLRFQQSLDMLLDQEDTYQLADIVYKNGYFDGSHFIRDFKSYTNYSPNKFKKILTKI